MCVFKPYEDFEEKNKKPEIKEEENKIIENQVPELLPTPLPIEEPKIIENKETIQAKKSESKPRKPPKKKNIRSSSSSSSRSRSRRPSRHKSRKNYKSTQFNRHRHQQSSKLVKLIFEKIYIFFLML